MRSLPHLAPLLAAGLALLSTTAAVGTAHAQTAPVLMLSDVHFDPFHDPAKVPQLLKEPIDRWPAIFSSPASPTQAADLQALQSKCDSHAPDTAWPLLTTSLAAAHDAAPRPLFITLSGDLLTHGFPCRFHHTAPTSTPDDLAGFSAKTITFVLAQLRRTYPRVPIYASLGNNDSGCADYRETPDDLFLKETSEALRAATLDRNLTFTPEGDYSLPLPAPIEHGRLIVLQDIFESREFATCAGPADRAPEVAQISWLRSQLAEARAANEHVWFMGHIPPGVDVYTSFRRFVLQPAELCKASPRPFLADTTLSDALLDYPDTVRLALFGHTHMDEIRLLHRPPSSSGDGKPMGQSPVIPAKLVPSITPYAGNHPAFVVATVDTRTAMLKDWRTFVSPGPEGSTPPWTESYRFTTAFHLPDFSAASAQKLADTFTADKTGQAAESSAFRQHFYPGDIGFYALGLAQIWPAYACAVREDRPSAVRDCICSTLPLSRPDAATP